MGKTIKNRPGMVKRKQHVSRKNGRGYVRGQWVRAATAKAASDYGTTVNGVLYPNGLTASDRRDLMDLEDLFAVREAENRDTLGFHRENGFNEWGVNRHGLMADGKPAFGRLEQIFYVRTNRPYDKRGFNVKNEWVGTPEMPKVGRATHRSPMGWDSNGFGPADPVTGARIHAMTGEEFGPPPDELDWFDCNRHTGLDSLGYNRDGVNPKTGRTQYEERGEH